MGTNPASTYFEINAGWNDENETAIRIHETAIDGDIYGAMINQSLVNARIIITAPDKSFVKVLRITSNPTLVASQIIGCSVQHLSTQGTATNDSVCFITISGIPGPGGTSGTAGSSGQDGHNARLIYSSDTNMATNPATNYFELNTAWSNTNQTRMLISGNPLSGDLSGSLQLVQPYELENSIIKITKESDPSVVKVLRVDSVTSTDVGGNLVFDLGVTHLATRGLSTLDDTNYAYIDVLLSGRDGTNGTSGISGTRGTSGTSGQSFSITQRVNGSTPGQSGHILLSISGESSTANSDSVLWADNWNTNGYYNRVYAGNFVTAGIQRWTHYLNTEIYPDYSFTASKAEITGSFRGSENNTTVPSFTGLASSGSLVEIFTSGGNYQKKSWAQKVTVICIGAGGGGGSGARRPTNATAAGGGGGGGGGAIVMSTFDNSILSATTGITVAAVGSAGTYPAVDGNGNPGGVGGDASFGSLLRAPGGRGGSGGATTALAAVNGGAAHGHRSQISTGGGPGGRGSNNLVAGTRDAPPLPYLQNLPFNGSNEIPADVAPTGGGGGTGYGATSDVTSNGGAGGSIQTSTTFTLNNGSTFTLLGPVVNTTTSNGTTASSIRFHNSLVRVGLGGRGASTAGNTQPVQGGTYGGGGGGGRGGTGAAGTGGATGGPGVVIVITE